MESVLLDKDGPVAYLTLNRPEKRNALSLELMTTMLDKLKIIEQDQDIRVVVIRGNGPAFCAGHDLKEMVGADLGVRYFHKIFSVCAEMMQTLFKLPQPVIAQVHGIATAAGCQLVAACDLAIAETGPWKLLNTAGILLLWESELFITRRTWTRRQLTIMPPMQLS